jgi:two-component system NtrC family sensor kinase
MTTHALFQMFNPRRQLQQQPPAASRPEERADLDATTTTAGSHDDELARLKRALWQCQRDARLGRLLAGVAHDMNNPLTIILGRAELLADDSAKGTGVRHAADRIADAARRCAGLVTGVLRLSGKSQGRAPRLADLLKGLMPLLAQGLQKQGVQVELALDDTLPPVGGDATELAHVVLALLDNARQALAETPEGTRRIVVRSGPDPRRAGWQWLSISDSGPGVPEALSARVFEPFFSTRGDAAGLGLTMARDAARAIGGELTLLADGDEGAAAKAEAGACLRLSWPTAQ